MCIGMKYVAILHFPLLLYSMRRPITNLIPYHYSTAMAMLYVGFAAFFRRHDFVLHDTLYERDVKIERDCFNGETSSDSKGVRVKYSHST